MKSLFLTVSDNQFFAGTLATCSSIRLFHPEAEIVVIDTDDDLALSPLQQELLERCRLRVISGRAILRSRPGRVPGAWQLKAYAARDLAEEYDLLIGIDSDLVLCAPVTDVMDAARTSGRFHGGQDVPQTYDDDYRAYGLATPTVNARYMSTSLYFCPVTSQNLEILEAWSSCCDRACFGPQPEKIYPGHGDQGVLNAIIYAKLGYGSAVLLPNALWSQHWTGWDSVLRVERGRLINLTEGGRPQRSLHSTGSEKFWSEAYRQKALDRFPAHAVDYAWWLYLLWFGPCQLWSYDPGEYLSETNHHLMQDLVDLFAHIQVFDSRVGEQWERLCDSPLFARILEVRTTETATLTRSCLPLARQVRPGGRIVNAGCLDAESASALAVTLLSRDVALYSVWPSNSLADDAGCSAPTPSVGQFGRRVHCKHPHLRLLSVPVPAHEAHAQFADNSVDLVLIPGYGDLELVFRTLDAWRPKLTCEGKVAGMGLDQPRVAMALKARFGEAVQGDARLWWYQPSAER